jgi:hypothetical protein
MAAEHLDHPLHHLSPEQIQHPQTIIEEFFHQYTLSECRQLLKETLHQALSGYHTRDGIHPADLFRFLEELEKAVEAMYIFSHQENKEHLL